METKIIGLTGNIACGKSSVAKLLSTFGVDIIDADLLSRDLSDKNFCLANDFTTYSDIVDLFSKKILDPDEQINRSALRSIVFNNPEMRKKLEQILHPAIKTLSQSLIKKYRDNDSRLIVYEATLLVETGRFRDFDGLLLVSANPETQLRRLLIRNPELSQELALQMIQAQMPLIEKAKFANWIIENNGSYDDLRSRVNLWIKERSKDGVIL